MALDAYLEAVLSGDIVMLAVGDEAGLNSINSCAFRSEEATQLALAALEDLGAKLLRPADDSEGLCYRKSWAMLAVKGVGVASDEQLEGPAGGCAQPRSRRGVVPGGLDTAL